MRNEENKPDYGLFKTSGTALVIGSLSVAVSLISILATSDAPNKTIDILTYGIPCFILLLGLGVIGMLSLTNADLPKFRLLSCIGSIVGGVIQAAIGILIWAGLKDMTLGICGLGIGVCLIGVGIAALLKYREQAK